MCLKYLHEQQADFAQVDLFGSSVLHKAAMKGDFQVLEYLIEECKLDQLLLQPNIDNFTPYEYFLDLCDKRGHPKQLTEESDYESTLGRVNEYLYLHTERKKCWSRRRLFICACFAVRRLRFI